MGLTITFNVEPDENGIIDGRTLAELLIADAYEALVPYVHGNPAFADQLFAAVAAKVFKELHEEGWEEGEMAGLLWRPGDRRDQEGISRHLSLAEPQTMAMLAEAQRSSGSGPAHEIVHPAEIARAFARIEDTMRDVLSVDQPPRVEATISEADLDLFKRALGQTVGRA